jgi:hypothetical protein
VDDEPEVEGYEVIPPGRAGAGGAAPRT